MDVPSGVELRQGPCDVGQDRHEVHVLAHAALAEAVPRVRHDEVQRSAVRLRERPEVLHHVRPRVLAVERLNCLISDGDGYSKLGRLDSLEP